MNEVGQMNFLIKILFVIIAIIIFVLVINYFISFRYEVVLQKEQSEFKISVLNTLQKLVSDEKCLSYKNGNPQKPILDINKINQFASIYSFVEPDCAKAISFDYSIRLIQLPYNFTVYPGEKRVRGELGLSNEFSSHPLGNYVPYFDCNFNPQEHPELCRNTELDRRVCSGCTENPRENCPYEKVGTICCIYYACPRYACKCVETKPGVGDCGSGCIVTKGCDLSKCSWYPWHGACGMTYSYTYVPSGEEVYVELAENVWEFGLSFGQTSFSPPKAKKEEIQLSLPVTIKYSETLSTEGVIYIYAVRGELEELYGTLEDICIKAAENKEIKFTKKFHFSYSVSYDPVNNMICMENSCKPLSCSYILNFDDIEKDGDYLLEFSFNPETGEIRVKK